jgi:hypothetical protein
MDNLAADILFESFRGIKNLYRYGGVATPVCDLFVPE